jgi:hypothetical protein
MASTKKKMRTAILQYEAVSIKAAVNNMYSVEKNISYQCYHFEAITLLNDLSVAKTKPGFQDLTLTMIISYFFEVLYLLLKAS